MLLRYIKSIRNHADQIDLQVIHCCIPILKMRLNDEYSSSSFSQRFQIPTVYENFNEMHTSLWEPCEAMSDFIEKLVQQV